MRHWADIVKASIGCDLTIAEAEELAQCAELSAGRKPPGQERALCQICPRLSTAHPGAEGEGDGHSTVRGDGDRP